VTGVSRKGRDRLSDAGRDEQPFTVHVAGSGGVEERLEARAVIDASGTWRMPNPAGADGLPALGERAAAGLVRYQIPDFAAAEPFAGKHTVVLGAGHSAATAVIELARIAEAHPGTTITWVLRRGVTGATFGGGTADELPERGALGLRAKQAVTDGLVGLVTGFRTERFRMEGERAVLVAEDGVSYLPPMRWWCSPGSARTCRSCRRCGSTWTRCCRRRAGSLPTSTRTSTPAGPPPRPWPGTSPTQSPACTWWG
jgi:hypothetical protein